MAEQYDETADFFSTNPPSASSTGLVPWSDPTLATAEAESLPQVSVWNQSGAQEEGETTGYFGFHACGGGCCGGGCCGCGAPSVTVRYTRRGTADTAAGVDYTGALAQNSVSVPLNDVAYQPFKAVDDTRLEETETVEVSISDDAAYTVGTRDATSTILDNESEVTIHSDTTMGEDGFGVFMAVRRTRSDHPVGLSVSLSGTAGLGVDFDVEGLGAGGLLSMDVNETEKQFRVIPRQDVLIERPESARFSVGIVSGTNHVVGKPSAATVTIVDDDGGEQPPHDGGKGPPGGGPGGGGPGGPGTGVPEDPNEAEPNAWVDVGLGGWGWWWYEEWYGKEGEKHYGSTTDGPGLTTGALLRLNRDYDESADHQGTTPPPTDLEKPGIVPWDGEVAPLWLWAWTDTGTEEAAANSRWTVTWDDSKVNVWQPQYDEQGNFLQYNRKSPGWSGTLEEMYGYHEDWYWWWGWGIGAIVDPVGVSSSVDDVSIVATLAPSEGASVEDTVKATVLDADLDVDGDNDGGFDPPARTAAEEWLEEDVEFDPVKAGKVLTVNKDDADADDIPDFADFDSSTAVGTDGAPLEQFVPVVVELGPSIDAATARLTFHYNGSDPAAVVRNGAGTPEDPYVYEPAAGMLRLWTKDGIEVRNPAGVDTGGDYVTPGVEIDASSLTFDSAGTATLWLEGIAPAASLFEGGVSVSVDPDGSGPAGYWALDAVRTTPIEWRFVEVDENNNLTPTQVFEYAHPSPVVDVTDLTIGNLRLSSDFTKIIGDLHVSGTIDSAVADSTPGTDGTIDVVNLYFNGAAEPLAVITTSTTKREPTEPSESLLKPHDFSATFDQTIVGVEVQQGWNVFKVTATDKVYGITGYSEHAGEVTVLPPVPEPVDVRLMMPGDPYSSPPEQVQVELRKSGGAWQLHTLSKTGASPLTYQSADGLVTVQVDASAPLSPDAPDSLNGVVWADNLEVEIGLLLTETGNATGQFDGSGQNQIEDWRRKNLELHRLPSTVQCHKTAGSTGGEDHAYLLQGVGPSKYLEQINNIETDDGLRAFIKNSDGKFFMAQKGAAANDPAAKSAVLRLRETVRNGEALEAVRVKDEVEYLKGVASGIVVKGAGGLLEGAWYVVKKYNTPRVLWDIFSGEKFREIKQNYQIATGVLEVVGPIVKKVIENDIATVEAVLSGNDAQLNAVGEDWRLMAEYLAEFFVQLSHEMGGMTDFQKGELVGQVMFEVITTVLPATKASKLATLQKMEKMPFFTGNNAVGKAFARVIALIRGLETTKMCFVAGTKVHTANGLVDIEDVRPGDLVLSRDEATGEQTYKPVLQTVTTHPDALYTIAYDVDGPGPLPSSEVVTTAPHPFYAVSKGFVPASDLRGGDSLALANGATAEVVAVTVQRGLPGELFTTYNFEVADFHTYFVNADGVWVHNSGNRICQKAFSIYRQFREFGRTPEAAFAEANKLISTYLRRGTISRDESVKHLGDALDEVVKHARQEGGKPVRSAPLWTPGKAGDPAVNMWQDHWLKHQPEFPDLGGPVAYVDTALDFTGRAAPGGGVRIGVKQRGAVQVRVVWEKSTRNFGVVELNADGTVGAVRTFFRPEYNKLPAYIRARFGPAQAEQALDQYFLDAIDREL